MLPENHDVKDETAAAASGRVAVLAGGSGFLGRVFAEAWSRGGGIPVVVSRHRPDWLERVPGTRWYPWDNATVGEWAKELSGAAVLVNLVGRTVDCRKTPANRREILESRVDSCRVLGEALRGCDDPPPVWLQSGTAHIIGDPIPLDAICDESTPPPDHGLAPQVGMAWEKAFNEAILPGQRGVLMRTSFVLGDGGAMRRLGKLARLGLGGTVGHGRQWISWIHEDDVARFMLTAIDDAAYQGMYMLTAPNPVTNKVFMRELRRAARRPWSPPAPAWGVRLASRFVLNTDPELALLGRRCVPTRLLEEGRFEFQWPEVGPALRSLFE